MRHYIIAAYIRDVFNYISKAIRNKRSGLLLDGLCTYSVEWTMLRLCACIRRRHRITRPFVYRSNNASAIGVYLDTSKQRNRSVEHKTLGHTYRVINDDILPKPPPSPPIGYEKREKLRRETGSQRRGSTRKKKNS